MKFRVLDSTVLFFGIFITIIGVSTIIENTLPLGVILFSYLLTLVGVSLTSLLLYGFYLQNKK